MNDYPLTGRKETDKCLTIANKVHNYYFEDPFKYKVEICKGTLDFIEAANLKLQKKYKVNDINSALKKHFLADGKYEFFINEIHFIRLRCMRVISNPKLLTKELTFLLENNCRFIETFLPFFCSVKKEVEERRKFTFTDIVSKKIDFFDPEVRKQQTNYNIYAFYDAAIRVQHDLTGMYYLRDTLNLDNPDVKYYYDSYGGIDLTSSILFSRLAQEQLLKYICESTPSCLKELVNHVLANKEVKDQILNNKEFGNRAITTVSRLHALKTLGILNPLIGNEIEFINKKGNNVAHNLFPGFYYSCYHNLQFLSYLDKTFIKK